MKQLLNRTLESKVLDLLKFVIQGIISAIFYKPTQTDGFEAHLDEAIELYKRRRLRYSELSNGESDRLFMTLITTEKMLKPIARIFDRAGQPFNKQDIGIIQDDFVSMSDTHDPEKPINPCRLMTEDDKSFSKHAIKSFEQFRKSNNFEALARHSVDTLEKINDYEKTQNIRLQMLKHIIESIGLGAINANTYREQSKGTTERLSIAFLNLQILSLNDGVIILDELANKLHHRGIGVLVNDLPTVPVLEKFTLEQDLQAA